ncbi:MAG: hypothetical protein HC933_01245 [Pleurocapsa sp. SU_196_0]|nr:hypothetical protein [Pleurocapsa sp. SU_196_0]
MTSSAALRLLLLAAIWGASFIFYRVIAPCWVRCGRRSSACCWQARCWSRWRS